MSTRLTVYSLSVKLETDDHQLQSHLKRFLDRYYTIKQRSFSGQTDGEAKVFTSKLKNEGTWFLHRTQFIHFYQHLKEIGYRLTDFEQINEFDYTPVPTSFKIRDGWALRDIQIPIYNFLLDNPIGSKLVPVNMGVGKTAISLITTGTIKHRLAVVILPGFIDKWHSDILKIHEVNSSDILLIQGSKSLIALIQMAKDNSLSYDYFVISSTTMQNYISAYESDPTLCVDMYGCAPIDLFPLLGVGVMINDETHMAFHALYKIILHTNVRFHIGLSGTLVSDDPVITRAHKIVYPKERTYGDTLIEKYIDIYPISYTVSERNRKYVKTKNFGSPNYSHTAFEKSILKNKFLKDNYTKLIKATLDDYYIDEYQANDKAVIFVAMIEMVNHLFKEFTELYPEKKVVRYCENDSYDEMLTGDIIVTTPGSLGTGIDVPNLRVGIQTVNISATAMNLQNLGRLRKLPDRDVKFCYLYAENIPKQKEYHRRRVDMFTDRARNFVYRRSRVGSI